MTDTEIAQDYLDCVMGLHGEWWQDRADEFIQDYWDVSEPVWALWDLIRRTESEPAS